MNTISLPALDGRSPLGFLAGLGVLRLLDRFTDDCPRLSWSEDDASAELHSGYSSLDEVVDALRRIVNEIPEGGVLPGVPANFPPPGEAPDRLRLEPTGLRDLLARYRTECGGLTDHYLELEAWMSSLVTDVALDKQGRAAISLFAAPSGKQSMYTMFRKPLDQVQRNPQVLREALESWRRYPGVTGEYLDHRVLFAAADAGDGESRERGVPGATWLALMSYPYFQTTAQGTSPVTTSWYRRPRRPTVFMYPLWARPLRPASVVALLEHRVVGDHLDDAPGVVAAELRAMEVFELCRHQRRQISGRTFAGVLGPVQ